MMHRMIPEDFQQHHYKNLVFQNKFIENKWFNKNKLKNKSIIYI